MRELLVEISTSVKAELRLVAPTSMLGGGILVRRGQMTYDCHFYSD